MKLLPFIQALVLGATALHAQSVDESDVVVSLSAEIIWGVQGSHNPVPSTAQASLACYALADRLGWSDCQVTTTRGASLPGTSAPMRLNTRLIPGVAYTVLMRVDNHFDPSQSAPYQGTQGFYLNAVAPEGYVVELSETPGCERINDAFNNNAQESLKSVKIRVLSAAPAPPLGPGMATSLGLEKKLWQLSLGSAANGAPAGTLSFNTQTSSVALTAVFTRQNVSFDGIAATGLFFLEEDGMVKQVIAPQVCVEIVGAATSGNVEFKCYHPAQRSSLPSPPTGYYTFTGDPFAWYIVQSDGGGIMITADMRNLSAGNFTGPVRRSLLTRLDRTGTAPDFTWTAAAWHTTWSASSESTSAIPLARSVRARNGLSEAVTTKDGANNVALSTTWSYTAFGGPIGDEVTSESSGASNLVQTDYSFYTTDLTKASYGRPRIVQTNGGNWAGSVYDDEDGRIIASYMPFSDNDSVPGSLPASSGLVTSYTYSPDPWLRNTRLASIEAKLNGTTVSSSTISYVNETPFSAFNTHPNMKVVKATRVDDGGTAGSLTTITKHFSEAAPFFHGQIYSREGPDKVKQSFIYQNGSWNGTTFTPTANAGLDALGLMTTSGVPIAATDRSFRVAVVTGSSEATAGTLFSAYGSYPVDPVYLVPGKSTLEVTIRDGYANVVRTETLVWSSDAWQLVSWTTADYDLLSQPTNRTSSNGGVWSAIYDAERKTQETDDSGVTLSYTYDAAGRIDTVTRAAAGSTIAALTTKFTYNAAGQVLQQIVGHGLSESLTSSKAFDVAGRLVNESSPGPNGPLTTTYSYSPTTRQVTATLPNTGTRIETSRRDGQVASVMGTAVVPEHYTYELNGTGATAEMRLGGSSSERLRKTWTDRFGRTTKTLRPGFTGQVAFEETNTFDATTGRLTKTARTGLAATLYGYDALSQPVRSGLDLNANDTLDLASNDRIADADQYFEYTSSAWWLTKIANTYPTAGSNTPFTVSTTRQRLTGFTGNLRAETRTIDADGNTTTQTTSVNRATKTTTITTTTNVLSNPQTETHVNGFLINVTGFDGLTYETGYDALGRRNTSTDPRTGSVTTTYKPGSTFVWYVQDAVSPTPNTVATYTYDNAGRATAVTSAAGQITYTAYNTLDQVLRQWGAAAHPVEFGYNALGERESMKTYRGGSGWDVASWPGSPGTADWTRWEYDGPSGLLAAKYDAANLNATTGLPIASPKKISFTYNSRGQTTTRTWARNVTTTYGYDPGTGELLTQTYAGGAATPGVTFAYTRAGQLGTVTDGTGTRTFNYGVAGASPASHPLELGSIILGSFYNSRTLTRKYDTFHRPAGFKLGTGYDSAADLSQLHAYNTLGRFDNIISASGAQAARTFTYGYTANSSLVETLGIGGSPFAVTRGYEPKRNLATSIETKWGTTNVRTRYDYTYNTLGQRYTAKQSGDVFADLGGSTYYRNVYNARGELESAADYLGETPTPLGGTPNAAAQLPGRNFAYNYDNLGNRTSASRTGTAGAPDGFTPNNLNQYISRTNPYAHAAGTARADSAIAVTGGTGVSGLGRQGRYWDAQVTLDNTTGPAKGNLTVTATLAGSPSLMRTETKTAYLPPASQTFTYDDDGNLTGDGLWTYVYDAENRLITMTATAGANSAISGGFADRLLEFKYDYLGRRVQKRSAILSSNGGFTPGDTYRRYLYDGWNLVAEFDATSTTCGALVKSFTWGLDIAGSLSATGGVGALVQITEHTGTMASYFPTYDGNGNIASLLRASDGAAVAKYEYSPFGELLRAEGSYAASNPFRFSTKFTDDESGLVYYGHRYYSPTLGRFINRDLIAEQGGLNLYGFCGNDGVNHTDYLGYSWLSKALKKLSRASHKLFRALTPIREIRSMSRRLERWEANHQQELKIAAAIVASIFTYGAVSGLVSSALNATTMTVAASGAVTVTATGSGLMAASLAAASGTIGGIVGGAAAGFIGSAIITGDLKESLKGAAAGAIMGGISGYYGRSWTVGRVAASSVGGGLASEVSGGSFRQGALFSGGISLATFGAIKLREWQWENSNKYIAPDGSRPNASGDSVGFNGDGKKLGGGRFDWNYPVEGQIPSPLGGIQGGQGEIFGMPYKAGSIFDRMTEAYAGVHDSLNHPWWYGADGNIRMLSTMSGLHHGAARLMNWANVAIATPMVAASVIGISPSLQIGLFAASQDP